jgi:hypothetical protein
MLLFIPIATSIQKVKLNIDFILSDKKVCSALNLLGHRGSFEITRFSDQQRTTGNGRLTN